MSDGEPIRCVVRMARTEAGYGDSSDGGSVFIAGNALELVPPDRAEGTRHAFSRIFDAHASDHELWEAEAKPLIAALVAGENVSIVLAGHMRSGRDSVFSAMAALSIDELFETMGQRQTQLIAGAADPSSAGGGVDFTVSARYVSITPGDPASMTDLIAAGASSVHIVVDPSAGAGVQLKGAEPRVVGSQSELAEVLKTARARLRGSRPPAPSSALVVELRQGRRQRARGKQPGATPDGAPSDLISTLTIFDIEVGALGDPLSNGLRQLLSGPNSAVANYAGPALLLRDSVGGNTRTALVGTVRPADHPESEATLQLVAGGAVFTNYPLVNDRRTRGLLAHHRWVSAQLQEQLSVAEGKLQYGVDQLQADRRALPNQLRGAAERLQALVDQMQRDAAGKAGERERLMAELLEVRSSFNGASGELVSLKEELIGEKRQKVALSRELVEVQLAANEEAAARAERNFGLENEAVAASDVMRQMQARSLEAEAELEEKRGALAQALASGGNSALEAAELRAQLRSIRAESLEAREREDELTLELLNLTNAKGAVQALADEAAARLGAAEKEAEAQRARAEEGSAAAQAARDEALMLAAHVAELKVSMERQALALQQDRLALQRTAVEAAETQLSRVQDAEARAAATGRARAEAERSRDDTAHQSSSALGEMREVESSLRLQLAEHALQVAALQRHVELLGRIKAAGSLSEEERAEAVEGVHKLKTKELKAALAERGLSDKGKKEELLRLLEEAVLAELEAAAKQRAEEAEVEAAARGADQKQLLTDELLSYEKQLNGTLEVNRALVEAYWRMRAVVGEEKLPSHAELLGEAAIEPETGRRAVMTELEKGLAKEKVALAKALAAAQAQLDEAAEQAAQQLQAAQGNLAVQKTAVKGKEAEAEERGAAMQAALARAETAETRCQAVEARLAAEETAAALRLRAMDDESMSVDERRRHDKAMLTELVEGKKTDELEAEALRKALKQLEADKAELGARLHESETLAAPPFATKPGEYEAALADRNAQLRELKWKVAEHTQSEAALERERTEMKRRAYAAEDQLEELQRYLSTNIARYQKEILRLREMLKAKGVSAAGAPLQRGGGGGDAGAVRGEPGALRGEAGLLPREGRLLPSKDLLPLPPAGGGAFLRE